MLLAVQAVAASPLISPATLPESATAAQARAVPPSLADRADSPERAVQALLRARTDAVARKDRAAWLATVDPGQPALRRRQAELFDSLVRLPVSGWSARLADAPAAALTGRTTGWAARIDIAYRLSGWDSLPVPTTRAMTFASTDGRWYVTADRDGPAGTGELWDHGPVVAVRRGPVLALGLRGSERQLTGIADVAAAAVPRATSFWGTQWSQRLVVVVPPTQSALRALVGGNGPMGAIAAYASERAPGAGERIVVNAATFALLGRVGRRVVLTHEAAHVAARRATGPRTPAWLAEGLADHVGYSGLSLPVETALRELSAQAREGRLPTRLPADADFDAAVPELAASYEQAWQAVELLVRRHGRAAFLRYYRAVGAGEDADIAMRRLLRTDIATFTRDWQADLRRRLA